MANVEETRIRETIQIYFDSMFESKADKVHQAFHPNARISGDTPQGFFEMTVADFASFVEAQPAARDAGETPFLRCYRWMCMVKRRWPGSEMTTSGTDISIRFHL